MAQLSLTVNEYTVKLDMYLNTGKKIALTEYLKGFTLIHSLKLISPIIILKIQNIMFHIINENIKYFEIDVVSNDEFGSAIHHSKYKLNIISMPNKLYLPSQYETASYYMDKTIIEIYCFIDDIYNVVTTKIQPLSFNNTSLNNILNSITSLNSNIELDTSINMTSDSIPQCYIPTTSMGMAINYLQYWIGFYPGSTVISFYPYNDKIKLLIKDVNNEITNMDKSDIDIYQLSINSKIEKQFQSEYKNPEKTITSLNVAKHENNLPLNSIESNFRIINKPYNSLFSTTKYDLETFLNTYCAVDKSVDLEEDNIKPLVNSTTKLLINHTGMNNNTNWFTSNFANKFLHSSRLTFDLERKLKFGYVWPGMICNYIVNDPDQSKFGGKYVIENIIQHMDYTTGTWKSNMLLTSTRTNVYKRN